MKQLTKQELIDLPIGSKVKPADTKKGKSKFILELTQKSKYQLFWKVTNDKNPDYSPTWLNGVQEDGTYVMPRWSTIFFKL